MFGERPIQGLFPGDPAFMEAKHEEKKDERYSDDMEKILGFWSFNFSKMTVNEKGQTRNRVFRQSERPE